MEKISGILPESPRIKAQKEPLRPVRPGAPAFGREDGSSDIRDKVSISSAKNIGVQDFQPYRNPKEAKHAQIVEDLSRKFFSSQSPGTKSAPTSSEFPEVEGINSVEPLKNEGLESVRSFDNEP